MTQTKQALLKALNQSDSLRETYKKVMQMDSNRLSDVGITFEGNTDNEKTREFDLFMNDIDLREDIVTVERKLKDKENIIDLISSKQDSGFVDHTKDFWINLTYKFLSGAYSFFGVFGNVSKTIFKISGKI